MGGNGRRVFRGSGTISGWPKRGVKRVGSVERRRRLVEGEGGSMKIVNVQKVVRMPGK